MESNLAVIPEVTEEIIGGRIVAMSPRPALNHNMVCNNIFSVFSFFLKGKRCTPFADGTDLYLTETERYVPDMMVVCDPSKFRWNGVHGAPDLVAEVLSPRSAKADRGHKKAVYEACGVKEYWIVDTMNRAVEQYLLTGGRYVLNEIYTLYPDYMLEDMDAEERAALKTVFRCSLFPELEISLEDIFARMI